MRDDMLPYADQKRMSACQEVLSNIDGSHYLLHEIIKFLKFEDVLHLIYSGKNINIALKKLFKKNSNFKKMIHSAYLPYRLRESLNNIGPEFMLTFVTKSSISDTRANLDLIEIKSQNERKMVINDIKSIAKSVDLDRDSNNRPCIFYCSTVPAFFSVLFLMIIVLSPKNDLPNENLDYVGGVVVASAIAMISWCIAIWAYRGYAEHQRLGVANTEMVRVSANYHSFLNNQENLQNSRISVIDEENNDEECATGTNEEKQPLNQCRKTL